VLPCHIQFWGIKKAINLNFVVDTMNMILRQNGLRGWEMDGTGSGSRSVVGFGISGVEPLCSATGELINPLNAELNPIYNFLALLEAHPILHISGVRVNW
jgi:hypothetical protein